jgi:hypothetical protein
MCFAKWSGGRPSAAALLGLVALLAAGCGRTGRVTGTVTYENKPLAFGRIIFNSGDSRPNGVGNIVDGNYEVTDAPLGECKVTVETVMPNMPNLPGMPGMPGGMPGMPGGIPPGKGAKDRDAARNKILEKDNPEMADLAAQMREKFVEIPGNYTDAQQTPLSHNVTRGSSQASFTLEKPAGWKPGSQMKPPGLPK